MFPVLSARALRRRDDLEESSRGEKVVKRVSGVSSCLYESAPPSLGGEDGWKAISCVWAMMAADAVVIVVVGCGNRGSFRTL